LSIKKYLIALWKIYQCLWIAHWWCMISRKKSWNYIYGLTLPFLPVLTGPKILEKRYPPDQTLLGTMDECNRLFLSPAVFAEIIKLQLFYEQFLYLICSLWLLAIQVYGAYWDVYEFRCNKSKSKGSQ
jgi:hypothetical protein